MLTKTSTTNLDDINREHGKQGMLANKEKGNALRSITGASYKPRAPHGTKANTPVLAMTTTKRPLTKVI